jgi:site-specific DNA-methyltransferase (adenine-specific)
MGYKLICGDALMELRRMEPNSVDAVCCDPPYGICFLGEGWDEDIPSVEIWVECLRVLKPGGHLLAFGSPKTYHRLAVNIEDAGFEIRDMIQWVYGSSIPKGRDVGKTIEKRGGDGTKWKGWMSVLKPAAEPICLARKPMVGKNVTTNVLKFGTGALNLGACSFDSQDRGEGAPGRLPSNFILDESAAQMLDDQSGRLKSGRVLDSYVAKEHRSLSMVGKTPEVKMKDTPSSAGGASRFFYCAKASRQDRNNGLEDPGPQFKKGATLRKVQLTETKGNNHPTVKPTELMRYLCRLVTPPGGTVLDPFMGSGSTGKGAVLEGFRFIGIEREASFVEIAKARISHAEKLSGNIASSRPARPRRNISGLLNAKVSKNQIGLFDKIDGRKIER